MRSIPIASITITNRQRTEGKTSKDVEQLKRSILHKGLLHPPVLSYDPIHATYQLIAGERRLIAQSELHEDCLAYCYDQEPVPTGETPYTLVAELSEADLAEAELEENILRADLPWQDLQRAKVLIHELRKAANPSQSQSDTAKEILQIKGQEVTPAAVAAGQKELSIAKIVVDHLDMPTVASAPSVKQAYNAVLDHHKRKLERDLIKLSPAASPHKCLLGDARLIMQTMDTGQFDCIIADPPYGINAHRSGAATGGGHLYDDSPTYALDFTKCILRRGFDLLKPRGSLFIFCDIEHFISLRTTAEQLAYSTFRTPLVWAKGGEGHAPWGRDGFKRTYELILYAVKGQRPLVLSGGPDIKTVVRATRSDDRVHAAEKPPELLRLLLSLACRAGDSVLDPCCGSGPIFTAASGLGISVTGIELADDYHARACERLAHPEEAPADIITHQRTVEDDLDMLLSDG